MFTEVVRTHASSSYIYRLRGSSFMAFNAAREVEGICCALIVTFVRKIAVHTAR